MNLGALTGLKPKPKPWVYYPLRDPVTGRSAYVAPSGLDGKSITADETGILTTRVDGLMGIPGDGSVKAFRVIVIGRNTTVQSSHYIYAYSYRNPDLNFAPPLVPVYYGKFAGDYTSNMGMVMTGGIANTQFRYTTAWTSGTGTLYIRIVGYYVEAD